MKKQIKLSIIVPCYKVEEYLPRCLDSLVNQTLEDIEVICINDGSPDNCINILKDYHKKYGDKIVIIDKKNEGVWRGRKDGIKIAKGEFIGFVDSDDYVALDYAESLYKSAIDNNSDIAVCGFDRIDLDTGKLFSREMCKKDDKIIDIKNHPEDLLEMNGAPWNKIYRAELLKKQHDLKNVPKILDDMMFQLLLYINAKKVSFVNKSLVYYMVRSDSIMTATVKQDKIESTYNAMLEIRNIYKSENKDMLEYIDVNAFLHLGVSLMYRLSYDKEADFNKILKNNSEFLNTNFPMWKKSKYIKLGYVLKNHGKNMKLWIVKVFYKLHMFKLFLAMYKFMIDKLRVDIKW